MPTRKPSEAEPAATPMASAMNQNCTCPGPRRGDSVQPARHASTASAQGAARRGASQDPRPPSVIPTPSSPAP